ncbi:MAG: MFS transporter [bacterium]|nr:MFS transporter [bacterium]
MVLRGHGCQESNTYGLGQKQCKLFRPGTLEWPELNLARRPVARTEPNPTKPFRFGTLLRIKDFRYLWLGQIVSNLGDSMTNLALLLLINHLTGSTAALATMAILLALPSLTFGLFAGVIVDRADRKRIMLLSDLLRSIFVLGFILVDGPERIWRGAQTDLLKPGAGRLRARFCRHHARFGRGQHPAHPGADR